MEKDVRREHGYHAVPVKRVVQETADTRSYVLDVPDDLRDTFRYRSGQFCTFRVHLGEEEHLRSYSMSSAPETDADLTVTVKRVPGGLISNWFNDEVAEGDVLELTKPAGVFCVQDETAAGGGVLRWERRHPGDLDRQDACSPPRSGRCGSSTRTATATR